eukprot:11958318-Prorocentrum_lima.AAC.1
MTLLLVLRLRGSMRQILDKMDITPDQQRITLQHPEGSDPPMGAPPPCRHAAPHWPSPRWQQQGGARFL